MGGTQVKTAKGTGAEVAPESNLEGMEAKAEPTGAREIASLTPMMRQYLELKALHPDTILFFRLGDFYEMFFEDADPRVASARHHPHRSRQGQRERVPMCGVPLPLGPPLHRPPRRAGHKVAICEQMEEPGNGPGIVKRDVTRIITPGMVLDEEVLEPRASNFLAAVHWAERGFGAALEASTGEFFTVEVATAQELVEALSRVDLASCSCPRASGPRPRCPSSPRACLARPR